MAIATGVWGERWNGVIICEANRACVWEFRKEGIRQLMDYCHNNYVKKGINATVFGIDDGATIRYSVFVQSGFLRRIPENEDIVKRRGIGRPKAKEEASRTK